MMSKPLYTTDRRVAIVAGTSRPDSARKPDRWTMWARSARTALEGRTWPDGIAYHFLKTTSRDCMAGVLSALEEALGQWCWRWCWTRGH